MNYWLFLIPFASALLGWLLHKIAVWYILKTYWPQKQALLSKSIGSWASGIFSFSDIEKKIADPSVLEKAMPAIENHIDKFLNEKLQQEIPMLSMFIGTKTTDKIKDIFIAQLKQLFPTVMAQMTGNLKENLNIGEKISSKLAEPAIQQLMTEQLKNQLKTLPILGLGTGFLIGIINLIIVFIAN